MRFVVADALKLIVLTRVFWTIFFLSIIVVGIALTEYGDERSVAIGTSLIASGLVALATILVDFVRSGEQLRIAELSKAGLLAVQNRRDLGEYEPLVRKAYQIDVAGYTLRSFTEANIGHIRERLGSGSPIRVRMLMVDPSTSIAKAMQKNEGHPPGSYTKSHKAVQSLLAGLEESVEVRTIDFPLPAMIYRIDDILYTGPYPKNEPSRLATTYKIGRKGWMFEKTIKEFESLWSEARPVSIVSST